MKQVNNIGKKLFIIAFLILGLGIVIQYSASSYLSAEKYNNPNYLIKSQIMKILISIPLFLSFYLLDYRILKKLSHAFLFISFVLLIMCFTLNKGPVKRWISLGLFRFQPSELTKLSLIIFLSYYIDKHNTLLNKDLKRFVIAISTILISVLLIGLQKDFSTSVAIFLICLVMLFIGGIKIQRVAAILGIFALLSGVLIIKEPYRVKRIVSYFQDPKAVTGDNYQIFQSLVSLGNGGLSGKGLGKSVEKNMFLPNAHTDFVFSVFGEEFGFIGSCFIMLLFFLLFIYSLRISLRAPDSFGKLLGSGLSFSIFIYFLLNVGVVIKLFPVTGLPLPFISYGGSAMMYNLSATGIVLNISKKIKAVEEPSINVCYEY